MGIERIVTQFRRVIETTGSTADVIAAMADVTQWLGFRHFAISHHVDRATGGKAIRLNNYPVRWVEYYERRALGTVDPVHRASHMTSEGFWWSDMSGLIRLNERDEEIMKLGRIQGIGQGFTIPNNLPRSAVPALSLPNRVHPGSRHPGGWPNSPDWPPSAAHRLWPGRSALPIGSRPVLTPQQSACVELAARHRSPDRSISRHNRRDGGQPCQECLREVRREQADIAGGLRAVERRDHARNFSCGAIPLSGIVRTALPTLAPSQRETSLCLFGIQPNRT
jgi:LuxR family quorum-sensing system transcriptional regulator CciR